MKGALSPLLPLPSVVALKLKENDVICFLRKLIPTIHRKLMQASYR